MQHLVPATQHTDEYGFNPLVEYPDDVARLVRAALSQGYRLRQGAAAELWKRHSDEYCASWLVMEGSNDEDLVRIMLAHATVVDEPTPAVPPPDGYATWLDYAVATMDTRQPYLEQLLAETTPKHSRESMRQAVQDELADLRKLAGL